MTARKVGNRWAVVKKNGSLGKGRYKSKSAALKAQAKGRRLAKMNPLPKGGSKTSSGSSAPVGGASTSKVARIGVILRRARTALNITAPGWGAFRPVFSGGSGLFEQSLFDGIERYSGWDPETGDFDLHFATPTYQGITVSLLNDAFDRKLRNSARISKGKIFPILSEVLPMLRARAEVPAGIPNPMYEAARGYNKRTTGYDPTGHNFMLDRIEEYAVGKGLVAIYNKVIPADWKAAANKVLPKGWNPF